MGQHDTKMERDTKHQRGERFNSIAAPQHPNLAPPLTPPPLQTLKPHAQLAASIPNTCTPARPCSVSSPNTCKLRQGPMVRTTAAKVKALNARPKVHGSSTFFRLSERLKIRILASCEGNRCPLNVTRTHGLESLVQIYG